MTVSVALVEHRYGTNCYVGITDAHVIQQLADYCRDYWEDEELTGDPPVNDDDCIEEYFSKLGTESYVLHSGIVVEGAA